jgi:ABC-type nitrate/sulfonate/bicarbonate transport system permease component
MLTAKNNFRPDLVLAAVLLSAVLTLILFAAAVLVGHLAMPWRNSAGSVKR